MKKEFKQVTAKVLSRRVFITTMATILLSITIYSFITPGAMNFDLHETMRFFVKMLFTALMIGPFAALSVLGFFRPVAKVIRSYEEGKPVFEDGFFKARKALKSIPIFLFYVGSVSYVLGAALNLLPAYLRGETVDLDYAISRILIALSWGSVTGVLCGRMLNITLIEAKAKLNIYNLSQMKDEKYSSIRMNMMIPLVLLFLFIFVYTNVAYYFKMKSILNVHYQQIASSITGGSINAESVQTSTAALMKNNFGMFILVTSAVLIIMLFLAYVVILEITSHLRNLREQIAELSKGEMDLTRRINIVSFDDVGIMTSGINAIIQKLNATFIEVRKLIQNVYQTSQVMNETVMKSSDQSSKMGSLILTVESSITDQVDTINKTAQLLENMMPVIESSIEKIGAQSTAVDTTSKGITEIIHAIEVIDQSAAREEDIYKDIVVMIESGSSMIENSIQAMQAIEETSHKITDIVGIIANIADSTNTLAMNAAIEAAHAGEFGKGFAIVSQEIRSLAEGTSQSTDTIETLIADMTQKISNGVNAFAELKNILEKMISGMRTTGTYITDITSQTREQSSRAAKHLDDIGSLVNMTDSLKSNAVSQKEINVQLEQALTELNEAAKNVISVNAALTESMISITNAFEQIHGSSNNTFSDIKRLESQISSFKLDTNEDRLRGDEKTGSVIAQEISDMAHTYNMDIIEEE